MIWRIRERAVFGRFRSDGRRFRHDPLWLTWIDDPAAVPPRVAFAVGRPVGTAVTRNLVRRRLRAAVTGAARSEGELPAGWYLLGATPAAAGAPYSSLSTAVSGLCRAVRAEARP